MTNKELKDIISECVIDEDELDEIIVLEGDEFADAAIGLTDTNHIVYDYEKIINSLVRHGYTEEEAIEWVDYNTLGSLPYMSTIGKEPIIIMTRF